MDYTPAFEGIFECAALTQRDVSVAGWPNRGSAYQSCTMGTVTPGILRISILIGPADLWSDGDPSPLW